MLTKSEIEMNKNIAEAEQIVAIVEGDKETTENVAGENTTTEPSEATGEPAAPLGDPDTAGDDIDHNGPAAA